MAIRACKDCGELVDGQWRCDRCKRLRGQHPTRYNGAHQAKRKRERDLMYGKPCARCGRPLTAPIELDHRDDDPSKWLGWSHKRCNRAARNRLHNNAGGNRRGWSPPRAPAVPPYEVEIEPGVWLLDHTPRHQDAPTIPQGTGTPARQHSRSW
jgi:hypothetical protein